MKQVNALTKLILLMTLTVSWTLCAGQGKKELSITEYRQLIEDVNIGNRALRELATYKVQAAKDSIAIAALQSLIAAKDEQLSANNRREQICYEEKANLSAQMRSRDAIIQKDRETITKLAKKDRRAGLGVGMGWSFGTKAGMPISSLHVMPSLVLGFTYQLIRF